MMKYNNKILEMVELKQRLALTTELEEKVKKKLSSYSNSGHGIFQREGLGVETMRESKEVQK